MTTEGSLQSLSRPGAIWHRAFCGWSWSQCITLGPVYHRSPGGLGFPYVVSCGKPRKPPVPFGDGWYHPFIVMLGYVIYTHSWSCWGYLYHLYHWVSHIAWHDPGRWSEEDAIQSRTSWPFCPFVSTSWMVIEDVSAARIQSLYLQRLFSAGDVCWHFSPGAGRPIQSVSPQTIPNTAPIETATLIFCQIDVELLHSCRLCICQSWSP